MNFVKVYWSCFVFDMFVMFLMEVMVMGKMIVKFEYVCYGYICFIYVFVGNEDNWFELVNMVIVVLCNVLEDNCEYVFGVFLCIIMKEGYWMFFVDWLK